jgi:L-arabinonolactonase
MNAMLGQVAPVTTLRAQVGESPVWCAQAEALFWVDIHGRAVIRTCPQTGTDRVFGTPEMAGAVCPTSEGGLLVAGETGVFVAAAGASTWTMLSAPADLTAGHRFNDATVDPAGRLIVGTMNKASERGPTGVLYSLGEQGWRRLDDGLRVSNGLAFSPAGDRMYVSDSHAEVQRIWCYDYDVRAGVASNKRVLFDMRSVDGRPDGAAVDSSGQYWTAAVGGACLHAIDASGRLDQTIALPIEGPTKLAFAPGTMFITSLSMNLIRPDPAQLAGALLMSATALTGPVPPPFQLRRG